MKAGRGRPLRECRRADTAVERIACPHVIAVGRRDFAYAQASNIIHPRSSSGQRDRTRIRARTIVIRLGDRQGLSSSELSGGERGRFAPRQRFVADT